MSESDPDQSSKQTHAFRPTLRLSEMSAERVNAVFAGNYDTTDVKPTETLKTMPPFRHTQANQKRSKVKYSKGLTGWLEWMCERRPLKQQRPFVVPSKTKEPLWA